MKKGLLIFLFTITALAGFSQTTYNDVATIFYEKCAVCHRPSGGGPFSLTNYAETAPWASTIATVVSSKEMPPWSADTSYMHFSNERVLTQSEYDAVLDWVSDGALEGNPGSLPAAPVYPDYLINGTPDLVLEMDTLFSTASTIDEYYTIVIPTGLTQDRYIRGIEIIAGDPSLIHHALINADSAGAVSNDFSGTSFNIEGEIEIGIYVPGANPLLFPNSTELKLGIEIPQNGDLVLQIHTPKGTAGQPITAQIRLFLYPAGEPGIRDVVSKTALEYWGSDFWFLPEQTKMISAEATSLPVDISIYSGLPHAHQICTEILNYAYMGTDTIPLIFVDSWDFEHQEYYYYNNLVKIPANYIFRAEHLYENTSSNPDNPFSPPQLITAGSASTDEMLFDSYQFMLYQAGDENINVDSILQADPLLNTFTYVGLNNIEVSIKPSYVFPNPVEEQASIYFYHPHSNWDQYSIRFWTMDGKLVHLPTTNRNGYFEVQRGTASSGYLIYEILNKGELLSTGSMMLK
ncbi:MAG: hypothetical protein JKY54_08350 [Flavobacteriales bacterium]|nr:hypothetical protein [Flavobacteriales bacterium]